MALTKWLAGILLPLWLLSPQVLATTNTATPAAQHFSLTELQKQLAAHTLVKGDFTQVRHLSMFNQPLSSNGQFVLSRDLGLWWQQTQPFAVSLILTQDKLSQQFGDEAPQLMNAQENPMVFYFTHLFLSLFQGNTQKLQEQFSVSLTGSASHWQLQLTPKNPPLTKVFGAISLSGGADLDRLVLSELRGDSTEISFSHQSHPDELTQDERNVFAL
ncbi:MAG: outer membrane lipoprotein carrier protein LolA [Shewanella sp.]|nr:outer membrane lipoprotein carrier protein LolA [Shewanella sp.]MCF1431111.1 outer membrane lipoprotein carrier protein LolA [Shewanella sp.]MCF1458681.1 outer membrane lipoprotein carrier protein LolA [Shewanella sp.]